jgi:hypothetical protein
MLALGVVEGPRAQRVVDHVLICDECGGRLAEALRYAGRLAQWSPVVRERRSALRIAVGRPIRIRQVASSFQDFIRASVLSAGRGRVECSAYQPLRAGACVELFQAALVCFGQVARCVVDGPSFRLEIAVDARPAAAPGD